MKDTYIFIHDTIIHWIDKTDNKANIIIGLKIFILGYFLSTLSIINNQLIHNILYILCMIAMCISFFFLIKIIYPKLSTGEPESLIFFLHLYKQFKSNKKETYLKLLNLKNDKFEGDLITQILSLSEVANNKYNLLQKGIFFLIIELIIIILISII